MASSALKSARMELKTTPRVKELLNAAASLTGLDLTSFVLACAEERAKYVLSEHHTLNLSRKEQARLMTALLTPAKPNRALKKLMSSESLVER